MKKGWQAKKITENGKGYHFTRWYITAPSNHVYYIYRGCIWNTIYLCLSTGDRVDEQASELMGERFHDAVKRIYEIEAAGTYSEAVNKYVKSREEYRKACLSAPKHLMSNYQIRKE